MFSRTGLLPIYPVIGKLDNCTFSASTVWQPTLSENDGFRFDDKRPAGRQFFAEATSLPTIADGAYQVVLASHVIEHSANPIRALREWMRVLSPTGLLVMFVPHREGTFDHRRAITTLQHMISDFDARVGEDDLTHLAEILELHDLARDPAAGDLDAFRARSEKNFENRCLHQHVFDTLRALELVNHAGLRIHDVEAIAPIHILIIASKAAAGDAVDNRRFLSTQADWRRKSPFSTDRTR